MFPMGRHILFCGQSLRDASDRAVNGRPHILKGAVASFGTVQVFIVIGMFYNILI